MEIISRIFRRVMLKLTIKPFRNKAQRCSVKKMFLKISQNSKENTCVRVSFFAKCWLEACKFIKKETLAQVFFCEFCEISKNTFFHGTPLVAASDFSWRLPYWAGKNCFSSSTASDFNLMCKNIILNVISLKITGTKFYNVNQFSNYCKNESLRKTFYLMADLHI